MSSSNLTARDTGLPRAHQIGRRALPPTRALPVLLPTKDVGVELNPSHEWKSQKKLFVKRECVMLGSIYTRVCDEILSKAAPDAESTSAETSSTEFRSKTSSSALEINTDLPLLVPYHHRRKYTPSPERSPSFLERFLSFVSGVEAVSYVEEDLVYVD